MGKGMNPEKAIAFTKLSVALTCSWPPSPKTTKIQLFFFNTLWFAAFVSAIGLFLPLLSACYEYRKNPIVLGKSVSLCAAVAQVTIKMIMCRSQQKQFQVLYFDMEDFCKRATPSERIVLQRYVDRYKYFHSVYTLWCFLTTVFVISGPLYSPQTFPTHAIYPFSVERQPLKCFIFFHQSLVGFQVSSGMATDTQIALLMRYAAARFELLAMHLHAAKSDREFNACIKEHTELLRYTRKACKSVRFLVLATVATTTIAVIFGSLNLVTVSVGEYVDQPLPLKVLYAIVVFTASVELFMYAWPADSLMRMSAKIATDAYNTNWFESDLATQRKIYFIILRSQKLEIIRINGIVPKLSLLYYAKYLYKSTSYFAALRIIVEK